LLSQTPLQTQDRGAEDGVTEDESSDIVPDQAALAYDLPDVKPHQHLCGHQTVPQRLLKEKKP
ncbi:hypothetical protein N327_04112, partial [Fulmarus glacialis]